MLLTEGEGVTGGARTEVSEADGGQSSQTVCILDLSRRLARVQHLHLTDGHFIFYPTQIDAQRSTDCSLRNVSSQRTEPLARIRE